MALRLGRTTRPAAWNIAAASGGHGLTGDWTFFDENVTGSVTMRRTSSYRAMTQESRMGL